MNTPKSLILTEIIVKECERVIVEGNAVGFFIEKEEDEEDGEIIYKIRHRGKGLAAVIEKETLVTPVEYAILFLSLIKETEDEGVKRVELKKEEENITKQIYTFQRKIKLKTILIQLWEMLFLVFIFCFMTYLIKKLNILVYFTV